MKTALFVDFDNVFSGLMRISAESAKRFASQPSRWLRWLTDDLRQVPGNADNGAMRRVLVRRCYMNPVMYQRFRRPFHEAGFEIVDCPPMTAAGKTSTDIHLVLDTIDALHDHTHFDEFVMFSADADFSPVLRRLRRHDRRTAVFAAGAMSEAYKASADVVIDIPTFIRDGLDLALAEAESDAEKDSALGDASDPHQGLRSRVVQASRKVVLGAAGPVPLASLATALQRQIPGLRESQWAGAGGFGALMRQLELPDVSIDFQKDLAYAMSRMSLATGEPAVANVRTPDPAPADSDPPQSGDLSSSQLDDAAANLVRRLVGEAPRPLPLSLLGHALRKEFAQLSTGWNGARTLSAFLQRLHLEPLQRSAPEDGSTIVLYDPGRHAVAPAAVIDPAIAAMLRAAELPLMKPADFALVLDHARPHMGTGEPFEISAVSRGMHEGLTAGGHTIPAQRIAKVLQALIFGGLDTTAKFDRPADLGRVAMGVILAAWSRESQAPVDDDARSRIVGWLKAPPDHENDSPPQP